MNDSSSELGAGRGSSPEPGNDPGTHPRGSVRPPVTRLGVRRALTLLLLLALGLPALVWLLHPWPPPLRWLDPHTTAFMEHRQAEAQARGDSIQIQWEWIPLDSIPGHLQQAVLVAEDDRFRDHRGVDWEALAEEVRYQGQIPFRPGAAEDRQALRHAVTYVREHRDEIRGRSTLTQQLARNLYLSPDRAFIRKGQELILARRLETFLSKDRILELYLNVAELGDGIFGVEAAAREYFGRSASQLSRPQAAALAATLPHPRTSNPAHNPGRMQWRQGLILTRMDGGSVPVSPPEEGQLEEPTQGDSLPELELERESLEELPEPAIQGGEEEPGEGVGHSPEEGEGTALGRELVEDGQAPTGTEEPDSLLEASSAIGDHRNDEVEEDGVEGGTWESGGLGIHLPNLDR
jgi:monofunctional glycosyltransferase